MAISFQLGFPFLLFYGWPETPVQGILRFKKIYKYIYTLINGKAKQTHIGWISGAQLLAAPRAGVDMGPQVSPHPTSMPTLGTWMGEQHPSQTQREQSGESGRQAGRGSSSLRLCQDWLIFLRSLHFLWSGIFQWKNVFRRFLASPVHIPLGVCFISGLFQYLMSAQFLHGVQMFGIKFPRKTP